MSQCFPLQVSDTLLLAAAATEGSALVTPDPTGLAQSHCAPSEGRGFSDFSLFICLQTFWVEPLFGL